MGPHKSFQEWHVPDTVIEAACCLSVPPVRLSRREPPFAKANHNESWERLFPNFNKVDERRRWSELNWMLNERGEIGRIK